MTGKVNQTNLATKPATSLARLGVFFIVLLIGLQFRNKAEEGRRDGA